MASTELRGMNLKYTNHRFI